MRLSLRRRFHPGMQDALRGNLDLFPTWFSIQARLVSGPATRDELASFLMQGSKFADWASCRRSLANTISRMKAADQLGELDDGRIVLLIKTGVVTWTTWCYFAALPAVLIMGYILYTFVGLAVAAGLLALSFPVVFAPAMYEFFRVMKMDGRQRANGGNGKNGVAEST